MSTTISVALHNGCMWYMKEGKVFLSLISRIFFKSVNNVAKSAIICIRIISLKGDYEQT